MAEIIDGKAVSAKVRAQIKEDSSEFEKSTGIKPGLAVIIVGEDPASKIYVRNKAKACEEVGFYSEVYELPEDTTERALLDLVHSLNHNNLIHGILVQSPLPKHLASMRSFQSILKHSSVHPDWMWVSLKDRWETPR